MEEAVAAVTGAEIYAFLRGHRLAVISSVSPAAAPQAALIGIAVTEALDIIFDTLSTSRKYANLRADPRVALGKPSKPCSMKASPNCFRAMH